MKYRLKNSAFYGLMTALLCLLLRIMLVCTGNSNATSMDIVRLTIDFLVDSLAILLVLAISAIQSFASYKTSKVTFGLNAVAFVNCTLLLWDLPENELWHTYGTYFSLFFVLVGLCFVNNDCDQCTEDADNRKRAVQKGIAAFLVVVMIIMAVMSFLLGTPQFVVSDGAIYLLFLVVAILAWDSVESLSLGSIVTLKKTIKDQGKVVEDLKTENRDLRNQITSIVHNNQMLNVEINNGKGPVQPDIQDDSPNKDTDLDFEKVDRILEIDSRLNRAEQSMYSMQYLLEKKVLSKFANKNSISLKDIQMDVKFSREFLENDPIRIRNVIFDAYTKRTLDELFIEIKSRYPSGYGTDQLYHMLSLISRYSRNNKANAKLVIIIPKLTEAGMLKVFGRKIEADERDKRAFQEKYMPAIKNGLLEIAEIEITDDELAMLQMGKDFPQ